MLLNWLHMRLAYLLAEGHALLGHDHRWSSYLSFCFLSPQAEEEQSMRCCDATETIKGLSSFLPIIKRSFST